jgi:hypothetical protein
MHLLARKCLFGCSDVDTRLLVGLQLTCCVRI